MSVARGPIRRDFGAKAGRARPKVQLGIMKLGVSVPTRVQDLTIPKLLDPRDGRTPPARSWRCMTKGGWMPLRGNVPNRLTWFPYGTATRYNLGSWMIGRAMRLGAFRVSFRIGRPPPDRLGYRCLPIWYVAMLWRSGWRNASHVGVFRCESRTSDDLADARTVCTLIHIADLELVVTHAIDCAFANWESLNQSQLCRGAQS